MRARGLLEMHAGSFRSAAAVRCGLIIVFGAHRRVVGDERARRDGVDGIKGRSCGAVQCMQAVDYLRRCAFVSSMVLA